MSDLVNHFIAKKIEIDKNHIDNFVLETEEGTKRTKEKFYRQAAEQRNEYVQKQQEQFNLYLAKIKDEMRVRFQHENPTSREEEHQQDLKKVDDLLNCIFLNSDISDSFKLKIDFIIASIQETTTLEDLNLILKSFIDRFAELGIPLTIDDFKYTMFTERYMVSFLKSSDFQEMKDIFEKIYFACPDIKLQLKMNLLHIVRKYEKLLSIGVSQVKAKCFSECSVTPANVVDTYISTRSRVGTEIAVDEYNNANLFLSKEKKIDDYLVGSGLRDKNYNTFVVEGKTYDSLNDDDKMRFNSAMMGFYLTLNELKKYYQYEFIIKDLVERYKNKDSVKNQYAAKKKEIEKEEKAREAIYKQYQKANGIGFLAKKNDEKAHMAMKQMNEQILKLRGLYDELEDLAITTQLAKLNDSATIYDLFLVSLTSFSFLEKSFMGVEDFALKKLEDTVYDYFRFLYNPNNNFLRKINVFADYNIASVVSEKYRLLDIAVTPDMIEAEMITATMETVGYINLIQNIDRSKISLQTISNLCKMSEIIKTDDVL